MYKLYIGKNKNSQEMLKKILKKYHLKDDIFYNEYGKPYLKGNSLYFNISHSHDYTVIVIADSEVGVDIQKITFPKKIINHICNDEEKKYLKSPKDFTKMWVKKESYVKYLGIGIGYGLKKVDTLHLPNIKLKKYKNYYIGIYL